MDDLSQCLVQVLDLCLETSTFIDQLYKFEYQLAKLYSFSHRPSKRFTSILERFSTTIIDLNDYHRNHFIAFYTRVYSFLSREQFTIRAGDRRTSDFNRYFSKNLLRLNQRLHSHNRVCHCLRMLSVTCSLGFEYRRSCTSLELADRFVSIRLELIDGLEEMHRQVRYLLIRINRNYQHRRKTDYFQYQNKNEITNRQMSNVTRTILLWIIVILAIGCYLTWPIVYENQSKQGRPM